MREDLQRRISAAIDSAEGVEGDPGLRALLDADPEAAAYAHDVARLGRILRDWPLPEPDDAAFEALASRIEQRLGDATGLARIADPTAPPQFDDDDDLRDATAGLLGSVLADADLELESVPPARPVGRPLPAAPTPPRPAAGAAMPKPAPMPARPAAAGPPPLASAAPRAREIPRLVPASQQAEERLSFPSFPTAPPTPMDLASAPLRAVPPPRERTRKGLGWIAGLAAAAAVGLGVFATTQMAEPGELASMPSAPSGAAAVTVAAEVDVQREADAQREVDAQREAEPPLAEPAMPPPAPPAPARAAAEEASASAFAVARSEPVDGELRQQSARLDRGASAARAEARDEYAAPRRRSAPASAPASASGSASGSAGGGALAAAPRAIVEPRAAEPVRAGATTSAPASASRAPVVEPVPDEDLPETPARGEVQAALQAVEPAVRACAEAEHGTAQVRIVVVGSGRVTTATVSGQFAGTPVGSCIARAVRTARFPRFSADRFEITYPFQL